MSMRLISLGGLFAIAASSYAIDLFDNFGPGDTYTVGIGYTISDIQAVANPFSSGITANLSSVKLALFAGSDYTVSVATGGATTPGPDLVSWTVIGGGLQTLTPGSTVTLTPGDYYVVVKKFGNLDGAWNWNSIGDSGPFSFTNPANTWNATSGTRSVMRVSVEAVPEPASLVALGGLVALALRRKRK
jgi:hypothetical protein